MVRGLRSNPAIYHPHLPPTLLSPISTRWNAQPSSPVPCSSIPTHPLHAPFHGMVFVVCLACCSVQLAAPAIHPSSIPPSSSSRQRHCLHAIISIPPPTKCDIFEFNSRAQSHVSPFLTLCMPLYIFIAFPCIIDAYFLPPLITQPTHYISSSSYIMHEYLCCDHALSLPPFSLNPSRAPLPPSTSPHSLFPWLHLMPLICQQC